MNKIYGKIYNDETPDSEIIQEIESTKREDLGFDINLVWNDWTLLIWSIFQNRRELVKYLLTYPDIDVNLECFVWDNTALHESCFTNNIHFLKLLLGHKNINVNAQEYWGWTGLHIACLEGYKAHVKELLLDARIDLSIRDKDGRTARDCAIRETHPEIANMLKRTECTSLLRIPNASLCRDITRMIIEEYV